MSSVNSRQINQARNDALNYLYDPAMDPRYSPEARDMISNLTQNVSLEASRRAAAGEGDYGAILQNLMSQTGLSEGGYDDYVQRLRDTGSLGIRDMGGNLLDNQLTQGNLGAFSIWNGRVTEPWEGVLQNKDGTYTIYNDRSRDQVINARQNAAMGGTAMDLSANGPHSADYYRAADRYNNMVANGYNFERHNPNGGAAAVLNDHANLGAAGTAPTGMQVAGAASAPVAGVSAVPAQGGGGYGGGYAAAQPAASMPIYNSASSRPATSPYSSALRNAQSGGFQWDKNSDPAYQAYKDTFERAARQATSDALGQVAARTGGMASSYATQAAQQSYNDQMQRLNDVVPELYQDAYNRFTNERAYEDAREQEAYERALQQEQLDYQRQKDAMQQQGNNYSNLLNLMKTYGYMPSASELASAGMSQGMMNAILGLGDYAPEVSQVLNYFTGGGAGGGTQGGGTVRAKAGGTAQPSAEPGGDLSSALSGLNAGTDSQYYTYLDQAMKLPLSQRVSWIGNLVNSGLISELQGSQLLSRLGL